MRNRANQGLDPTEIAREFGRDLRTVKEHLGLRIIGEPSERQGDEVIVPAQLELGVPREELVGRLVGYRDSLFQWPAPQPDQVVEVLLVLRWGRAEPLLWEYLMGNEGSQQRAQSRKGYIDRCRFLMELVESELAVMGLMLVRDKPLEAGKTPDFLATPSSSGRPPEEYLGSAMVAVVVRMMESSYDEARKQRFNDGFLKWFNPPQASLEFTSLFQGPEARLSSIKLANRVEEGFSNLWWKGLLVAQVKEATEPAVEEALNRIAAAHVTTPVWQEIVGEYEQITTGRVWPRVEG